MADYIYSISNNVPGGLFTANNSTLLSLLCRDFIPTNPLTNIGTDGDVLTISFQDPLTPTDKTALDGDMANPAGGLIDRSTHGYEFIYDSVVRIETSAEQALEPYPVTEDSIAAYPEADILFLSPNGIDVSSITLQYKDGLGNDHNGFGNRVEMIPQGIFPMNIDETTFNGSGQAVFRVGPSFDKGVIPLLVFAAYLPFKAIQLRFSDAHPEID